MRSLRLAWLSRSVKPKCSHELASEILAQMKDGGAYLIR